MQAELAAGTSTRAERLPELVVARRTARRAVRSGALWGYVFGIFVASSALSYSTIYKTRADRDRLAASFGSNHAASALFGPAPQLQTVAGFTIFKTSMTLMIIGSVWGLLTSTRLLRGEEDSGRWELLLCGQTTRRNAVVQALGGLGAGVAALWGLTAVIAVVVGQSSRVHIAPPACLFLATALVSSAVMFLAVGVLTSQLAATRRQAAGYAGAFLGASYAVRLLADAGIGLHALVWASPLGWVEQLQPLTSPHALALLPIGALTALLCLCAVILASRRDLGASVLADRATARPQLRLLFGPAGLSLRLLRSTVIAWSVAIAISAALMGVVAKAAGSTVTGSSLQQVFTRFGAPGAGARAFLGVAFVILAMLVGFEAAGQVTAARSEEALGHLDHLLSRPVSRWRWFVGRLVVALIAIVVAGLLAGVFAWGGAATQRSGVSILAAVGAGVNTVPPAMVVLGFGALVIGVWPRATAVAAYAVLVWSSLVEFVGGLVAQDHWLLDTSLFHQMSSAPAVPPHWEANAFMVALGLVSSAAGAFAFTRRDLQSE